VAKRSHEAVGFVTQMQDLTVSTSFSELRVAYIEQATLACTRTCKGDMERFLLQ
jgi:hypothetical protein